MPDSYLVEQRAVVAGTHPLQLYKQVVVHGGRNRLDEELTSSN
jgi:hypothetical protein